MLSSASTPDHFMLGIPLPPRRILYNFASYSSCGCFVLPLSIFTATISNVSICVARKISPNDPLPILRPSLYLPPTTLSMQLSCLFLFPLN
uniref:Casein kinase n=1 Tax=Rhizophora mucronata TaxID=61149 RepID=A0A2P2JYZ1_RHIMU